MSDKYVPELGKVIEGEAFRDAVHIAVAPVRASERLDPGQRVRLVDGAAANGEEWEDAIGVVDPFLTEPVKQGQRFWLFLFPNTITGLRHMWSHEAFKLKIPE